MTLVRTIVTADDTVAFKSVVPVVSLCQRSGPHGRSDSRIVTTPFPLDAPRGRKHGRGVDHGAQPPPAGLRENGDEPASRSICRRRCDQGNIAPCPASALSAKKSD